jgi:hypothetical protein
MASIKLGALVSDIRGSIGGTVYSRNNGGAYAKARIKGTNPNSTMQQMCRSIMAAMFTAWSAVTATVRTNWGTYAQNVSMINRLGDTINLSGYNMYARTRAVMIRLGKTMVAAAPTVMTLAEQDPTVVATPSLAGQNLSIAFNNALGWAGEIGGTLIIYQGPPQNAAVNSYKGQYKIIGEIDGAVTPPTSPATTVSAYTLALGQKCPVQFRILRADGRLSEPFRYLATVAS